MFSVLRENGKVRAFIKQNSDGSTSSFSMASPLYEDLLKWNDEQPADKKLDLNDKQPDPPTPKEIESARKFAVALQIIKAVPESWETGTAQQQIQWAFKQLFKRVAQEID